MYGVSPRQLNKENSTVTSTSVDTYSFPGTSACFIVGEKDGLTAEQMSISDEVFHVEVPCQNYADKVVYDSKVAICLQNFAHSTGMCPRQFENEKHTLGDVNFRRPKTIKAGRNNVRAQEECGEAAEVSALSEPLDTLFS